MVVASAVAVVIFALAIAARPPTSTPDPISVLRAAAVGYDSDTSGYLVDRVVETVHAKGGLIAIDRRQRKVQLRKDGEIVVERDLTGPAQSDATAHGSKSRPHFVFSNRYIQEYRLAPAPCAQCSDGEAAVSFESSEHDKGHGAGTIVVDLRRQRVMSVTYRPYVLPDRRMDTGDITIDFGTLAGSWLPVHCHLTFTAHYLIVHGSGTLDIASEAARRYSSFDAARAAYSSQEAAAM